MKIGEAISIKKPGILNGLAGTIVAIRYEVILKDMGTFYLTSDEIVHHVKDNSIQGLKMPKTNGDFEVQKEVYAELTKTVEPAGGKVKRPYVKKEANKPEKQKRKYTKK